MVGLLMAKKEITAVSFLNGIKKSILFLNLFLAYKVVVGADRVVSNGDTANKIGK